ncbi:Chaperone protein DnaK [Dissostichus eleginoides]|uniref:Chaperone protein DnaK n=1 Tax=Dissostichus eleginoides TaxID=100907 RepID=A0AAD9CE51_DISEL|nr:Chaperone protein DnaK [Dissostichus eleginoides]
MLFLRDEEEEQLRTLCQRLHVFLRDEEEEQLRTSCQRLQVVPQRRGGGTAEDFLSATPCCSSETRRRNS